MTRVLSSYGLEKKRFSDPCAACRAAVVFSVGLVMPGECFSVFCSILATNASHHNLENTGMLFVLFTSII